MTDLSQEMAKHLYSQGRGYKAIARAVNRPRSTVQMWRRRGQWERVVSPPTKGVVSPLLWCSSLHHESAHLVNTATLEPVCGAKLGRFANWTIQTEPLRKCTRCMPHEKRESDGAKGDGKGDFAKNPIPSGYTTSQNYTKHV